MILGLRLLHLESVHIMLYVCVEYLLRDFLTSELDVTRASDQVKSLTGDSALTTAREPKELNSGAHVVQPTRAVDMALQRRGWWR